MESSDAPVEEAPVEIKEPVNEPPEFPNEESFNEQPSPGAEYFPSRFNGPGPRGPYGGPPRFGPRGPRLVLFNVD